MPVDPQNPAERSILETSLLRKPFADAAAAAQEVRNVVVRSIRDDFRDTDTHPENMKSMLLEVGACSWPMGILGLVPLGVLELTSTLVIGVPILVLGSTAAVILRNVHRQKASTQLGAARKKLEAQTARMPNGRAKDLLRAFSVAAQRTFALGEIAGLQERIKAGGDDANTLRKVYRRGLKLIDTSCSCLQEQERKELKAAFRAGRLPQPSRYIDLLDTEYYAVQDLLEAALGRKNTLRATPERPKIGGPQVS